jgi:ABC-2 type transport system ATP-binding protein
MDHGKILALDTPENLKKSTGIDTIVTIKATGALDVLAKNLLEHVAGATHSRLIDKGVELHVAGGGQLLTRVIAAAEASGSQVQDLSVAEPSLETVFINLTGKELRD